MSDDLLASLACALRAIVWWRGFVWSQMIFCRARCLFSLPISWWMYGPFSFRLTCTHMNVSWPASLVSPPVARAGSKADEDAPCSQSFKIQKRLHRQAACSVHAREGAANQRLRLAASRCGRREARHQQRQGHPRGHLTGAATRREPEQQTSPWAGWASGVPHGNERAFAKPASRKLGSNASTRYGRASVRALRWANP